jgi:hypothetical protein
MTPNQRTLAKAVEAGQPIHMMHAFPKAWARAEKWTSLGRLTVKSDASTRLKVEIGGQDEAHKIQREQIILPPQQRMQCKSNFFSLSYLYTPNLPDGTIGVHSAQREETYLVDPMAWGNIWVYGMDVILGGYITRGEFRQKATRLHAGSRVFQYSRTQTENFALPIRQLKPLNDLFTQARKWAHT